MGHDSSTPTAVADAPHRVHPNRNPFHVRHLLLPDNRQVLQVDCVPTTTTRIVPPAGDEYAFDVQHYRRQVEVYVSPSGRSVRVWVDGEEVRGKRNG